MRIFYYAFLKEFLGHIAVGWLVFSFFFFFGQSSKFLEVALLSAGSNLLLFTQSLAVLYGHYWISLSGILWPMALALAVTLTISRLHEDHELLAFETLGLPIVRHLAGVLAVLALLALVPESLFLHRAMPQARLALKHFALQGKNSLDQFVIEPKTWIDLGNLKLFAESSKGDRLERVVVYVREKKDSQNNGHLYKVTAKEASYDLFESGAADRIFKLVLYDGKLELPSREFKGDRTIFYFGSYENYITLDPPKVFKRGWSEHTTRELMALAALNGAPSDLTQEVQGRFNLALSPLVLVLVSGFFSLHFGRKSKGFGFGLALGLLALYWLTLVFCSSVQAPLMTNIVYLFFSFTLGKILPDR